MDSTKPGSNIQLFEGQQIRWTWDDQTEQWLFSVHDVVQVLTDSADVKQYIKKMRARDPELNSSWGTLCTLTALQAADGKKYRTTAAPVSGILRIIQSIPSPKAEPLKLWLAKTGAERIAEDEDPEIAITRARESYLRKGYAPEWIDQRIMGIRVRNELTDQWKEHGVTDSRQYSSLTQAVHKGTFGITPKEHKATKGLKHQNLRDNMTTLETVLTMLGEATTAELTKTQNPDGFKENYRIAQQGGSIAGETRKHIEKLTGRPVVSSLNANSLIHGEDDAPAIATTLGKKPT